MDSNIYMNTVGYAREHGELQTFRENLRQSKACAAAIDAAARENPHNMSDALAAVREQFGLDRSAWVLAGHIQEQRYDQRFSPTNIDWSRGFDIPPDQTSRVSLGTHSVRLNDLADAVRVALTDREVSRGITPLDPHGYSAKFAETLLDKMEDARHRTLFSADEKNLVCNYAFHTGDATKTRQLAEELAQARFGMEHGGVHPAIADRVGAEIAAIDEEWEHQDARSPIAAVEMSTEQNYNQIDGLCNNMATPPADLTDGQTHEEIRELAPETLRTEKPSVLGRLREAREAAPCELGEHHKATKCKEELSR